MATFNDEPVNGAHMWVPENGMAFEPNGSSNWNQLASSPLVRPPVSAIPLGLQALYDRCVRVYPNQKNPLQVSAICKFWYVFETK